MKTVIALLLVGAAASALAGPSHLDASRAWAALWAEHEASELGYVEKADAFAPRFRAFADEHGGTPEALEALFNLFGNCWWKRGESEAAMVAAAKVVAEEILRDYADSEHLGGFTTRHYVLDTAGKLELFDTLRRSRHAVVRASGTLGLARAQDGDAAKQLYRELLDQYADLAYRYTTFGRIADSVLNKHDEDALKVGQPAPDIVGADADGNEFRLSDYRGKVVLLDFWGDW